MLVTQEKESRALRLLQYNQQREQAALEYQMKAAGLKVGSLINWYTAGLMMLVSIGFSTADDVLLDADYLVRLLLLQDGPSRAERMKQRQVTRCIHTTTCTDKAFATCIL